MLRDISILIILGIAAIAAIVGTLSVSVMKLPDDNPIEQAAEEVIKLETGMAVDLSPSQPGVEPVKAN